MFLTKNFNFLTKLKLKSNIPLHNFCLPRYFIAKYSQFKVYANISDPAIDLWLFSSFFPFCMSINVTGFRLRVWRKICERVKEKEKSVVVARVEIFFFHPLFPFCTVIHLFLIQDRWTNYWTTSFNTSGTLVCCLFPI